MTLNRAIILSLALLLAGNCSADAADICEQAKPANGSISWQVLGETKVKEQRVDGIWQSVPQFTSSVKALAGKAIKIRGYMLPLQSRESRSQFVLMSSTPDCTLSLKSGAELWMQVRAAFPVQYSREPLLLEGELELVKSDPDGILYRLNNAHVIN